MNFSEKTKNIFENSEDILMVFPKNREEDLSRELSLFYSLRKSGKKVNVLWQGDSKEFPYPFSQKIFAVSIKDSQRDVSEVHYEKNENGLKIYFGLDKGNIKEDDISFYYPRVLDPESEYYKENVGNIGDVCFEEPSNQIKLLSKALTKICFDKQKHIHWLGLTEKDFQETKTVSKDLSFVIEKLKQDFNYCPPLLFFWESHSSKRFIKGIFYSCDFAILKKISENFEGVRQESTARAMFLIRENNITAAKEKILKTL